MANKVIYNTNIFAIGHRTRQSMTTGKADCTSESTLSSDRLVSLFVSWSVAQNSVVSQPYTNGTAEVVTYPLSCSNMKTLFFIKNRNKWKGRNKTIFGPFITRANHCADTEYDTVTRMARRYIQSIHSWLFLSCTCRSAANIPNTDPASNSRLVEILQSTSLTNSKYLPNYIHSIRFLLLAARTATWLVSFRFDSLLCTQ